MDGQNRVAGAPGPGAQPGLQGAYGQAVGVLGIQAAQGAGRQIVNKTHVRPSRRGTPSGPSGASCTARTLAVSSAP